MQLKYSLSILFCCVLLTGSFLFSQQQVADTKFSVDRGFYTSPIKVKVTTATPGAEIRYTLNGTKPSASSGIVYTEPLTISSTTTLRAIAYKSGMDPTNVDTQTFIFLNDVINQPKLPKGRPERWYSDRGDFVPADYQMDPEYPDNDDTIREALLALPSVSIVMDPIYLFESNGIYNNGGRDNNAGYEFACSFEYIDPSDENSFQVNSGIQPRSHRAIDRCKRGFRLDFKSKYGPSKLKEPVFADATFSSSSLINDFDSIILRAGYMENYTGQIYNPALNIYFRDILVRDAQLAASGYGTHNTFVHLYLNGLYWGMYNLTEAIDADFLQNYHGGKEEDWLIVKSNADSHDDGQIVRGNPSRYVQLLQMCEEQDLKDSTAYKNAVSILNPERFADYLILQNFHAVGDWPDNNWVFVQKNGPLAEPGFFYCWDAEKTFLENDDPQSYKHARYSPYLWDDSKSQYVNKGLKTVPARIWNAMIENPDFRMTFADRVYSLLLRNGPLCNDSLFARFDRLADRLSLPVRADQKRWSDDDNRIQRPGYMFVHKDWQESVQRVRENIQKNVEHFIEEFRDHGLYPNTEPPGFSHPGGKVSKSFVLTIENPNSQGTIYYTTDNRDPRASGGTVSASALSSGQPVDVTIRQTQTIKARIRNNGEWSPLQSAVFYTPADLSDIKITEIMYHPPDYENTDGDKFEFIEIKNTSHDSLNISGVAFTDGISYQFPDGLSMPGKSFIVLCSDQEHFFEKYRLRPFGEYDGQLDNSGEKVTLSDALNQPIFSVEYDDSAPWPESPDGDGYSLVPKDFDHNPAPNNPDNWRASLFKLGSPGFNDSAKYVPPAPEDSNELLFVVQDRNLTDDDRTIYDRLIQNGYDVDILAQQHVSVGSAANKAAVLISESVNANDITGTFTDSEVPCIVCEPYIFNHMKMTAGKEDTDFGKASASSLVIENPLHDLAAGLSGTVPVLENPIQASWGKPAPTAEVIASWENYPDRAAIFAYERGMQMQGLQAPARRVGFYFNDGIALETTEQGWALFDAAVKWAADKTTTRAKEIKDEQQEVSGPSLYVLNQNYPNPFNASTMISFRLEQAGHVLLEVYNMNGRSVKTLLDSRREPGLYNFLWQGLDEAGQPVSSGLYVCRFTVDDSLVSTSKMLLLK